jgi:hypothetical protein
VGKGVLLFPTDSAEEVVYRDTPAGEGGLGVGDLACAAEDCRLVRPVGAVGCDGALSRVHIPDDARPRREVIHTFRLVCRIGGRAMIALRANLSGEQRRAVNEAFRVLRRRSSNAASGLNDRRRGRLTMKPTLSATA